MLSKIYQKTLKVIIVVTIFVFATRAWTVVCVNTATNIYFGSKSKWGRFFIVSDIETRTMKYGVIENAFYDVVKEPVSAIELDMEECFLNKCKPSLIISKNQDYIKQVAKEYPIQKISDKLESYIVIGQGSMSEDKTIFSFSIWDEVFYGALTKDAEYLTYSNLLLKEIILNELYRKSLPKERIVRILEEKEKHSRQKMDAMKQKYHKKNVNG